ncbi:hypothetical protein TRVA0_108S00100 [Trichomonascus vanleenenianus]|uniref:uncharacterized protein n=1 Tax=Trichomonascus vanleenenianus TaxID=2268995 RepID=UPI003EC9A3D9
MTSPAPPGDPASLKAWARENLKPPSACAGDFAHPLEAAMTDCDEADWARVHDKRTSTHRAALTKLQQLNFNKLAEAHLNLQAHCEKLTQFAIDMADLVERNEATMKGYQALIDKVSTKCNNLTTIVNSNKATLTKVADYAEKREELGLARKEYLAEASRVRDTRREVMAVHDEAKRHAQTAKAEATTAKKTSRLCCGLPQAYRGYLQGEGDQMDQHGEVRRRPR